MHSAALHRLAAFAMNDRGGNPAGVWLGDSLPEATVMQRIATQVGYSETAFLAPRTGTHRTVRYYSPEAEVSFCGHATIAAGVVLGETHGDDTYHLASAVGDIPVRVELRHGVREASLTSVEPKHSDVPEALLRQALAALHWKQGELDAAIPAARAYAGAWHLVLAVQEAERLAHLDYDFERLKKLMLLEDLTTLQLVWRESPLVFVARNPFPVGGVVEDPATGAAAAALGGYLRDAGLLQCPVSIHIRQGESMGSPSLLRVHIPPRGGIVVSGTARHIDSPPSNPST